MGNGVLRVVPFKIHFLTCLSSDHNKITMGNANIDALNAGSLRIKKNISFPSYFTFYKWWYMVSKNTNDLRHVTRSIQNNLINNIIVTL